MLPAFVAVLLLAHAPAWHDVSVTKHDGPLTATLTYQTRYAAAPVDVRNIRVRLVQRARVIFDYPLATHGANRRPELRLADVWGNSDPEAIVDLQSCGNRCGDTLDVVIGTTARVVTGWLGIDGWGLDGRDFVSRDSRFYCGFADCASSSTPVRVSAIDPSGRRLVDVSRSRPDLLRRDAQSQWQGYLDERAHPYGHSGGYPYPNWYGTLVPYCADEYRLGVRSYCERVLPAKIRHQLAAWGYR